jgi:hypothetical protein
MFSSVKFLSPIVTAGLPTPGPLAAAAAAVVVVFELEEDVLLLPQAAIPTLSAISANAAEIPRLNLPQLFHRLRVIASSRFVYFVDQNNKK